MKTKELLNEDVNSNLFPTHKQLLEYKTLALNEIKNNCDKLVKNKIITEKTKDLIFKDVFKNSYGKVFPELYKQTKKLLNKK